MDDKKGVQSKKMKLCLQMEALSFIKPLLA